MKTIKTLILVFLLLPCMQAQDIKQKKPVNWAAGAIILLIWLALAVFFARFAWQLFRK